MSTLSTFRFSAALPSSREPLELRVPIGAPIDYPVVYTLQIPSAHVSMTRWLEDGAHESEPYDWFAKAPHVSVASGAGHRPATAPRSRRASLDAAGRPVPATGLQTHCAEGTDHILFVLGLFFLGITWRKLLSQTTVFTIAHATTLFLSTYGIFSLPSRYGRTGHRAVDRLIAIENVLAPRLVRAAWPWYSPSGWCTGWALQQPERHSVPEA